MQRPPQYLCIVSVYCLCIVCVLQSRSHSFSGCFGKHKPALYSHRRQAGSGAAKRCLLHSLFNRNCARRRWQLNCNLLPTCTNRIAARFVDKVSGGCFSCSDDFCCFYLHNIHQIRIQNRAVAHLGFPPTRIRCH